MMSSVEAKSLSDFISKTEVIRNSSTADLFYRGHPDKSFTMTPSVFRVRSHYDNESRLLEDFSSEIPSIFRNDKTTFDKLVRCQHLGIPTRLLDITKNALTGLYFACNKNSDKDGEVIVLEIPRAVQKFSDSDTVSLLSNLAFLSSDEIDSIARTIGEIFKKYDHTSFARENREDCIVELMKNPAIGRLTHFIRAEKPYFQDLIYFEDLLYARAVVPRKNNNRIIAQAGAFIILGTVQVEHDAFRPNMKTSRIVIPKEQKATILQSLDALNINEYTMFPEPENIAKLIKRKYS